MKRILIFGSSGQLGTDLVKEFSQYEVFPYGHLDINLNHLDEIKSAVDESQPDWIINASAYNDVVMCESNPDAALAINVRAVWAMAKEARRVGATLVHFGTDYVFDGAKGEPYVESDCPHPLNVYATSKLAGEYMAMNTHRWFLFRVSALFGLAGCRTKGGSNFVEQILDRASRGGAVQVVQDKVCTPTFSLDVARYLRQHLSELQPGLYHLANSEPCTWYEFAGEILKQAGMEARLESFEDMGTLQRPANSALASEKIPPLRSWREALAEYLTLKRKRLQEE